MYHSLSLGNTFEFNNKSYKSASISQYKARSASDELALFWGGDQKIICISKTFDRLHFEDICTILNYENIVVISPDAIYPSLCKNLLASLDSLLAYLTPQQDLMINPWGVTKDFYLICDALTKNGINLSGTYPLEKYYWTSEYLDSKIGSKLTMASITNLTLPKTLLYSDDLVNIVSCVENYLNRGLNLAVKLDQDHGGRGIIIFSSRDLNKFLFDQITATFTDRILNKKLIVEEYIGNAESNISVSFDGFIDMEGHVIAKANSQMYINNGKTYLGLETGRGVLDEHLDHKMTDVGIKTGEIMSSMGFRGWYDIDMVYVPQTKVLYGTEINARRNGGTHVIEIAERLFGLNWKNISSLVSIDNLLLNKQFNSYKNIKTAITSLIGNNFDKSIGIIVVTSRGINSKQPYISYIAYGPDLLTAQQLSNEFKNIVGENK